MKQAWALAALAGTLIAGCATRQNYQGGSFDSSVVQPQDTGMGQGEGLPAPAEQPALQPAPVPGGNPGHLLPEEDSHSGSGPEFMLPRKKNETLRI